MIYHKVCKYCDKSFSAQNRSREYCSDTCRGRAHYHYQRKVPEKRSCPSCKKEFMQKTVVQIYCSRNCQNMHYREVVKQESKEKAKKEVKIGSLADVNNKARAIGMTYGQYMAMQYQVKGSCQ